jgi:hypothetical protein
MSPTAASLLFSILCARNPFVPDFYTIVLALAAARQLGQLENKFRL